MSSLTDSLPRQGGGTQTTTWMVTRRLIYVIFVKRIANGGKGSVRQHVQPTVQDGRMSGFEATVSVFEHLCAKCRN